MGNVNTYKHTQLGTVLIVGLALVLLVLAMVVPCPTWLVPLYAVLVLLFGWLTVEIREEFLVCRFGIGLIRKSFALRVRGHHRPSTSEESSTTVSHIARSRAIIWYSSEVMSSQVM